MGDRKLDRTFRRYRDRGDVAALGEAFDLAAPELMRVARHLARDPGDAEDLVQATFLTALAKADSYDGRRRVLPWLLGILSLHAREQRRRDGRVPDPDRLLEREERDPAERASDCEFQAAVQQAVGGLPETYRGVLFAHLTEGLEPREVAEEFGLSPVAARVRLHRGMKLLRRSLPPGFALGGGVAEAGGAPLHGWPPPSGPVDPGTLAGVRATVLEEAARLATGPAPGAVAATSLARALPLWLGAAAGTLVLAGGAAWLVDRGAEPRPAPAVPARTASLDRAPAPLPAPSADGQHPEAAPSAPPAEAVGRVLELDGRAPVGGVRIELWGPSGSLAEALTDPDGTFRIPVHDQALGLSATAPEHAQVRRSLRLGPGGTPELPGELLLAPGLLLEGTARTAGGRPVEGSLLVAADYLDWVALPAPLHGLAEVRSGRFAVPTRLAPGASRLAKVPGTGGDRCTYTLVLVRAEPDADGSVGWSTLHLAERSPGPARVELELPPTASLSLTVVDSAGRPLPGARVLAWPAPLEDLLHVDELGRPTLPAALEELLCARADGDGRVRLDHLPRPSRPTRLHLVAEAPGLGRGRTELAWGGPHGVPARLVLEVPPAARPHLQGRVVDGTGGAVEGAWIGWSEGGPRVESAPDGAFALGAPAGSGNLLRVETPSGAVHELPAPGGSREGWTLELPTGRDGAQRLRGRVQTEDGRGLADLELRLRGAEGTRTTYTDPAGRFDLPAPEGEALLELLLDPERFEPQAPRLLGPGAGALDLVARPRRLGTARLEVAVLADGRPVDPGRAVLVEGGPGTRLHPAALVHLTPGRVLAEDLAEGAWRLWVAREESGAGFLDLEVRSGDVRVQGQVHLRGPAQLEGRVVPGPGAADLAGAGLLLALEGPAPPALDLGSGTWAGFLPEARVQVGPDGEFRVEGLLAGPRRLALGPGGVRGEWRLELAPGSNGPLTLEAEPAGRIEVPRHLLPEAGHARLEAVEADGTLRRGPVVDLAAADGPLVLEVRPGTVEWTVRVSTSPFPGSSLLVPPLVGSAEVQAAGPLEAAGPGSPTPR